MANHTKGWHDVLQLFAFSFLSSRFPFQQTLRRKLCSLWMSPLAITGEMIITEHLVLCSAFQWTLWSVASSGDDQVDAWPSSRGTEGKGDSFQWHYVGDSIRLGESLCYAEPSKLREHHFHFREGKHKEVFSPSFYDSEASIQFAKMPLWYHIVNYASVNLHFCFGISTRVRGLHSRENLKQTNQSFVSPERPVDYLEKFLNFSPNIVELFLQEVKYVPVKSRSGRPRNWIHGSHHCFFCIICFKIN